MMIILGLIILIFLSFFVKDVGDYIGGIGDDEKCRASVIANAKTKTGLVETGLSGFTKPWGSETREIECPTKQITIKNQEIEKQDDIKKILANEMYSCWWKFGEGKLNAFSDWKTENVCAICSIVSFDEKTKEEYPKINKMSKYLVEKKIPFKEKTYHQYFTGKSITDESMLNELIDKEKPIITQIPYSTIFVITKQNTASEFYKSIGITSTTGAVGTGLAAVGGIILLNLIPGVNIAATTAIAAGGIGFGTGALTGGSIGSYIATEHKDQYSAAIYLVPYEFADLNAKCNSLGQDPFKEEREEVLS